MLHINPGQRLFTRDGRRIGNAELICKTGDEDQVLFKVKTDKGYEATLTENELRSAFFTDDFE